MAYAETERLPGSVDVTKAYTMNFSPSPIATVFGPRLSTKTDPLVMVGVAPEARGIATRKNTTAAEISTSRERLCRNPNFPFHPSDTLQIAGLHAAAHPLSEFILVPPFFYPVRVLVPSESGASRCAPFNRSKSPSRMPYRTCSRDDPHGVESLEDQPVASVGFRRIRVAVAPPTIVPSTLESHHHAPLPLSRRGFSFFLRTDRGPTETS